MHVLPKGFHRIRHYGLFANANRAENTPDGADRSDKGVARRELRIGLVITPSGTGGVEKRPRRAQPSAAHVAL
jgi:hypothetical protein